MKENKNGYPRKLLILYDIIIFILVDVLLLILFKGNDNLSTIGILENGLLAMIAVMGSRFALRIYQDILRYDGVQSYIKLMVSDAIGFVVYYLLARLLPIPRITFVRMLALSTLNLLGSLCMRMLYRYCYRYSNPDTPHGRFLGFVLHIFSGVVNQRDSESRGTKIAIFGAGDLGNSLYDDISVNKQFPYEVKCFIDEDSNKYGRYLGNAKVLSWAQATPSALIGDYGVQEIVIAVSALPQEKLKEIYERYSAAGLNVKTYDISDNVSITNGKRQLKEVQIEDLLFRKPVILECEATKAYYHGKVILITGGGGSIGSELSRQIAAYGPKTLIVLDIYENSAYDLQQELKMKYKNSLDFHVEICSITNKEALRRVFEKYRPEVIINAAAHKHVPLMEDNPQEAIENNVFGCKNLIELTEEYGARRFMMVSTDKAVNPTNVMGATKRLCEMLVLGASGWGKAVYSCTRFGNVLGSAGSVIPLFKRQIAAGGPVTVTDKRITRYFMTIPEASQLVLQSGAMAHNGELFVLDMGQPVKILDLAQNMIKLSGATGIEIIETGLRPGEKLYEELLIKSETLTKTSNNLIFVEKDELLSPEELESKLEKLQAVVHSKCTPEEVKSLLREVVPTYKRPEEVNAQVASSQTSTQYNNK